MLPNSNGNFTGKVAFVTGVGSGIGRATALNKTIETFGRLDAAFKNAGGGHNFNLGRLFLNNIT